MSAPANWLNDPYGRYSLRYWDGAAWTDQVVSGDGTHHTDPLGTSTVTPFAIPEQARGNPTPPARPATKRPSWWSRITRRMRRH